MSERIFANEPASSLAAQTSGVSPLSDSKLLARQIADDLGGIAPAIILAIATYPVVLAIGAAIVVIFVSGRTNYGWVEELEGIISYALIATMIGLYWTSIVAFATLICVYFFLRSFGLHVSCVRLGAFCGGLVGFVAVMPLIFLAALEAGLRELVTVLLVGPGLTTVVGQIGGAWGGSRVQRKSMIGVAARSGRIQFGIRHLMVACVWLALLLTAIRLSGLDFLAVLLLLVSWLVYQATTLWVGGLLARWFCRWKSGRQTRST